MTHTAGCTREKLAVVIPAFNEAASINQVLSNTRLHLTHPDDRIIVVDDSSTDTTAALARAQGVTVLSLCTNLGAWGAMQTGIRWAQTHGFTQVITLDADGQHDPAHIEQLLSSATQADVVIGSYTHRGDQARRLAWHWFRSLSGLAVDDLTSGYRLYRQRALGVLTSPAATLLDYQDIGLLMLLQANALEIAEVPITMHARHDGKSRIFSSWLKVVSYMLTTTLLCVSKRSQPTKHTPSGT